MKYYQEGVLLNEATDENDFTIASRLRRAIELARRDGDRRLSEESETAGETTFTPAQLLAERAMLEAGVVVSKIHELPLNFALETRLNGAPGRGTTFVSSKELETARDILSMADERSFRFDGTFPAGMFDTMLELGDAIKTVNNNVSTAA
jgi:hypothetical protein